ncbi:MAG: hypothetical protein K5880_21985 [Hydrogenophaga sp.]|uniref:hypothetical protein n=1 Tax=Hydrogenophaga sp. TaxID=1904254 RepID=UPI00262E9F9A|nr:hypothetical protein [Hydrogenophaga sp.]MCV0441273.1 hypothetical protein [Hydrogenophaga sp.]
MHTNNNPGKAHDAPNPPAKAVQAPVQRICFTGWLQRLLRTEGAAHREVMEEGRLEQLKRQMVNVLEPHMLHMSRRDMQLYLRVLAAEQREALRELRFEYFDLLCRMASEVEAMEHLVDLDAGLEQ